MKKFILIFILFISTILLYSSIYVVQEGNQAIVTQFGMPIGKPVTSAGLYFKTPFLQEVRYVDKRILTWDGFPNQIPTKDKKYIYVDTTARWKVTDALKFIQTVQNEKGARARLDTILDASTRDVISNQRLVEAVRNSNAILDKIKLDAEAPTSQIEEEIVGEIEKIEIGREKLSEMITKASTKELLPFGIELIDVQLRRISYEKSVEQKVYERMISERNRIAEKIRSIGKGEKAKIEGRVSKDLQNIESEAYKKSQEIIGMGEAKAISIYAEALEKDPEFFEFTRSMQAYEKALLKDSKFILSTDSNFLKFLK